jgi:hypothetical protein
MPLSAVIQRGRLSGMQLVCTVAPQPHGQSSAPNHRGLPSPTL